VPPNSTFVGKQSFVYAEANRERECAIIVISTDVYSIVSPGLAAPIKEKVGASDRSEAQSRTKQEQIDRPRSPIQPVCASLLERDSRRRCHMPQIKERPSRAEQWETASFCARQAGSPSRRGNNQLEKGANKFSHEFDKRRRGRSRTISSSA
jgi:hypothetical protein